MTQQLLLGDGRGVAIRRVKISLTTGGFLEGSMEVVREEVLKQARYSMGRNGEGRPAAYVVTPDRRLPEWQVEVELHSSPLPHNDPDKTWHAWVEHFSSVVMVFFCDDLSSATLTDLVAQRLSGMNEQLWTEHATEWSF